LSCSPFAALGAGCGSFAKKTSSTPVAPLKPPVTNETFALLACPKHHPYSTLAMEGCAEQSTPRTDKQINMQVATIFRLPPSARGLRFQRALMARVP
jgi:hypothetical protein